MIIMGHIFLCSRGNVSWNHLVKHSSFCFFNLVSSLAAAFRFLFGGISADWSVSESELLTENSKDYTSYMSHTGHVLSTSVSVIIIQIISFYQWSQKWCYRVLRNDYFCFSHWYYFYFQKPVTSVTWKRF